MEARRPGHRAVRRCPRDCGHFVWGLPDRARNLGFRPMRCEDWKISVERCDLLSIGRTSPCKERMVRAERKERQQWGDDCRTSGAGGRSASGDLTAPSGAGNQRLHRVPLFQ